MNSLFNTYSAVRSDYYSIGKSGGKVSPYI